MVAVEDFGTEVGPEFWGEVDEAVVGDVDDEVAENGSAGAARGRVVEIGEAGTHRAADDVVEIKSVGATVFADDEGAAYGVCGAIGERVPWAFTVVARVFVEGGGDEEVSEEILGGDVGVGGSEALGKGRPAFAVLRIGVSQLREDGVESSAACGEWAGGFVNEIGPALLVGVDRRLIGRGELDRGLRKRGGAQQQDVEDQTDEGVSESHAHNRNSVVEAHNQQVGPAWGVIIAEQYRVDFRARGKREKASEMEAFSIPTDVLKGTGAGPVPRR